MILSQHLRPIHHGLCEKRGKEKEETLREKRVLDYKDFKISQKSKHTFKI